MPSQSSRRKNDSKINPDHVAKLLQHGAIFGSPSEDLVAAATHLHFTGVIETETREYVRCSNAKDRDYPPRNRHCNGRVYVRSGSTEVSVCPECERKVYADNYQKQRFSELRTRVLRDGVLAHIRSILEGLKEDVKQIAAGVFRVEMGVAGVTVCLVEYAEERFLARERAVQHPSCFIAVNPRDFEGRFLDEDWVRRATLADVLSGAVDLIEIVRSTATDGTPLQVRQASIPVCVKGPTSVIAELLHPSASDRRFVVEVGANIVRIEGLKVVAEQAGSRFILFRVLWQCFLENLKAGVTPDKFDAKHLKYLIQQLEAQTNRKVDDEMTVRRAINRLQTDIEDAVKKKLGLPIAREDIIQTCAWSGQGSQEHGYRINPSTVVARPFQSNLS